MKTHQCGVALLTFAVALLPGGCTFSTGGGVDAKKAEKLMTTFLSKKFPDTKVSVECPKKIKAETDATFDCAATVDGKKLTITATQNDNKGNVSWQISSGLVEMVIKSGTEKLVSDYIDVNLRKKGVKVTCPETIEIGKGKVFQCDSTIEGVSVNAEVTQNDDQGNVNYKLISGIVDSGKLSAIISGSLAGQKIQADVVCEQNLYLSKPGSNFECQGKDSNGGSARISVDVKDQDGNVNWKIVEATPAKKKSK